MLARSERLQYSTLSDADVSELFAALSHPPVYAHIGGACVPSRAEFSTEMAARIAGPRARGRSEQWHNVVVRRTEESAAPIIGRLEATVYGAWAEVAYLFTPREWGVGYATEAMQWWHAYLAARGVRMAWAAVTPGNVASRRLLLRLGYTERQPEDTPVLGSYDPGDWVFSANLIAPDRAD